MGKELTNRQLAEGLGYALSKAEVSINKAVSKLESEREKIETFSVDIEGIERVYKNADERFQETLRVYVSDLRRVKETKPKWLKIKDWLLIGALSGLLVISVGFVISFYYEQNRLERENARLNNIVNNLSNFFGKHPKEAKTFEEWNK